MSAAPRIALFIDGANLYATSKQLGFDMDYRRLLREFQGRGNLIRAFYFTGDTGMAPTRSFQDGRRPRPDIWSFPVLGFGRHASFEEARAAGTPEQVIADWLDANCYTTESEEA